MIIKGRIIRGLGEGAKFTNIEWVVSQLHKKVNIIPYPGTLNVKISKNLVKQIKKAYLSKDLSLISPNKNFCNANLVKAVLNNKIHSVIVFPEEKVWRYCKYNDVLEIIAPVNVKETLKLIDGDEIEISIIK